MHRQKNVVTVQILVHACFSSSNDNLKSKVSFPARPPTADLRHGRRLGRPARLRPDMEKHRHADITCTWPRSLLLPQCLSQAPDTAFLFFIDFLRNCLSRGNSKGNKASACCAATDNMPVQRWPAALCRLGSGSGQAAKKILHFGPKTCAPRPPARPGHPHKRPAPTGTLGWRFRCSTSAATLPSTRSAPALAVPSRPMGLTKMVSTTAWVPCQNGRPFASTLMWPEFFGFFHAPCCVCVISDGRMRIFEFCQPGVSLLSGALTCWQGRGAASAR